MYSRNLFVLDFVRRFFVRWVIETAQDGYFYIKSKSTGLYLDIVGAGTTDGTKVHLYEIDVKKYGFQNRKLILNTPLHSKWRQQTVMTIAQF